MYSISRFKDQFAISQRSMGMVISFVGPILVAIVLMKIFKVEFALFPVSHTFGWRSPSAVEFLRSVATAPLTRVAVAIGVVYFIWVQARQKHFKAAFVSVAAVVLSLCLAKVVLLTFREDASLATFLLRTLQKATDDFCRWVNIFRADIKFLLAYTLFVYALSKSGKALQPYVFFGLLVLNSVFLILGALEVAYYSKTGIVFAPGDLPVLIYLLQNSADLWPIIKSEFNYTVALPLLLLLALAGAPLLIERTIFGKSRSAVLASKTSNFTTYKIALASVVLLMLVPTDKLDQQFFRLTGNTFNAVGRGALKSFASLANSDLADPHIKGFDFTGLEFVPATGTVTEARPPVHRPLNVVVIMLESVRARSTELYNESLKNTPFLKELGKKSLVVEEMYAVIPRTSAAWVSVLQGIYPSTNTVMARWAEQQQAHSRDFPSLPKLLAPHGYKSAFFVPTNTKYENEGRFLSNMGFDRVTIDKDYDSTGFERPSYLGIEDRVMLKPIASWIDEQTKTNTPFFLAVMTNVGHHKYEFPTYWKKQNFVQDEDENNYLNCISYIDDFLSKLFSEFSERKILDSTVFIILGDHGDSFGEHDVRLRALTLYDDELHVPMLIFAPGLYPNGGKLYGAHQQIDVLPTIADLLGYTMEGGRVPGLSVIARAKTPKPLFFSTIMDDMSLAMRLGSRKYIYNFDRTPMEVYDLVLDKDENRNIAKTVSSADLAWAEREMLEWSRKVRLTFASSHLSRN